MDDVSRCWLIALCVFIHFIFSAAETSFSCCNRFKFQVKADEGSKTSKAIIRICNKFDRTLTTVLVMQNIASIVISSVSTVLFLGLFNNVFDDSVISLLSSIIMALIVYILGDSLPKTIARIIPDTFSVILVWPTVIFGTILFPITFLFECLAKLIQKAFKVKEEDHFTEEDFENVVEKVSEDGVIEEEQSEIIQNTLDFADTNVKEVFTPKSKMVAFDITGLTNEKLLSLLNNTKYSRIPIYEKEFDNFIGVLLVKNYLKALIDNPNCSIRKTLQKPYFVSSNIMIDDLFNGFKKNRAHLAIVRNSNKEVLGMVTMEDVLEELVEGIAEPINVKGDKQ